LFPYVHATTLSLVLGSVRTYATLCMSRTPKILSCHLLKFFLAKTSIFKMSWNGLANYIVAAIAKLTTLEMATTKFSTTILLRATTLSAVMFPPMLLKYILKIVLKLKIE